MKNIVDK
jgi:hypothetical protein